MGISFLFSLYWSDNSEKSVELVTDTSREIKPIIEEAVALLSGTNRHESAIPLRAHHAK